MSEKHHELRFARPTPSARPGITPSLRRHAVAGIHQPASLRKRMARIPQIRVSRLINVPAYIARGLLSFIKG
jgi:hypothetical protein